MFEMRDFTPEEYLNTVYPLLNNSPFGLQVFGHEKIVGGYFKCGEWINMNFGDFFLAVGNLALFKKSFPATFEPADGFDAIGIVGSSVIPMFNSKTESNQG
jgi:hypothetical protein